MTARKALALAAAGWTAEVSRLPGGGDPDLPPAPRRRAEDVVEIEEAAP